MSGEGEVSTASPPRSSTPASKDGGAWGAVALGAILAVTVGWWSLALWPTAGEAPAWLASVRTVCFGSDGASGLPDASGWLLLIGQPVGMLAVLLVGWRDQVRSGLVQLVSGRLSRAVLGVALALLTVAAVAASTRISRAYRSMAPIFATGGIPMPSGLTVVPDLNGLVDHYGRDADVLRDLGRPLIVTFGFGHCATVCPLTVQQALLAQSRMEPALRPALVVITLDPWRDTPSRLSHLAATWGIGEDGYVLSGSVETVDAVLDAWAVDRSRDLGTGDIIHAPLTYLVDADGRVIHASPGNAADLEKKLLSAR